MGYGLPAAIGASVGSAREFEGKKPVWLIDGDGSFQMTSEELAAAFLDHAPVKIAILNNSVYGMVRQWQTLFYEHHYSQTNLLDGEAHGADGAAALADGDAPLEVLISSSWPKHTAAWVSARSPRKRRLPPSKRRTRSTTARC